MKKGMICLPLAVVLAVGAALPAQGQLSVEQQMEAMMDATNAVLAAEGLKIRLVMVEYLTNDCSANGSAVVSSDVGNKRAEFDFVPFDSRRLFDPPGSLPPWGDPGGGITYAIDTTGDAVPPAPVGTPPLTQGQTDAAIVQAMNTWDAVNCSFLPLERNDANGIDIGFEVYFNPVTPRNGSPNIVADIQHAGWLDQDFLDDGILSVSFTFAFLDQDDNYTDIDNNGRFDTAFHEIYYDPFVALAPRTWSVDGVSYLDVESVALHEAGHGLSQEHFGQVRVGDDGTCEFAPRAVMNATYDGPLRILQGTDNGGHCANWANWPAN